MNPAHTLANNLLLSVRKGQEAACCPIQRNVNPLLFQARIRTMKKLVLTLAIHDKDVTMTKAAHAGFTVWTGLALLFEEHPSTSAH